MFLEVLEGYSFSVGNIMKLRYLRNDSVVFSYFLSFVIIINIFFEIALIHNFLFNLNLLN